MVWRTHSLLIRDFRFDFLKIEKVLLKMVFLKMNPAIHESEFSQWKTKKKKRGYIRLVIVVLPI